MRFAVTTMLGFGFLAAGYIAATAAGSLPRPAPMPGRPSGLTPVEYWCSEGFAPASGGRCVATAARDEIELYVNDPALVEGGPPAPLRHHRRHRVLPLHERY